MRYRTVQIPERLINIIMTLLPVLSHRTHHELIIEAVRIRIEKLIKLQDSIKKVQKMHSDLENQDTHE